MSSLNKLQYLLVGVAALVPSGRRLAAVCRLLAVHAALTIPTGHALHRQQASCEGRATAGQGNKLKCKSHGSSLSFELERTEEREAGDFRGSGVKL